MPIGSSKIRRDALVCDHRPDCSLEGSRTGSLTSNEPRSNHGLAGLDPGQVEHVVDQGREPLGGLTDELDLLLLLGVRSPSLRASRKPVRPLIELSGERSSWLISERKRDFEIGKPLEGLGAFVELGIEGDHASVGLIELAAVHLGDLGLAFAQLLKGAEQLLVLLLELFQAAPGVRFSPARPRFCPVPAG